MPDAAHHFAGGAGGEEGDGLVSSVTLHAHDTDLDELVVVKRSIRFGNHGVAHACLADMNDRFQGVAEAAEMTTLLIGEFHLADCTGLHGSPASGRTLARRRSVSLDLAPSQGLASRPHYRPDTISGDARGLIHPCEPLALLQMRLSRPDCY